VRTGEFHLSISWRPDGPAEIVVPLRRSGPNPCIYPALTDWAINFQSFGPKSSDSTSTEFLPRIAALESGCYFIQTNGPNWQLNRTMDRLLSLHPFHAGPGPWSL
jgi:hypothetical protein